MLTALFGKTNRLVTSYNLVDIYAQTKCMRIHSSLVPGGGPVSVKRSAIDLSAVLFSRSSELSKTYGCVLVKEIVKLSGPFHGHAITVRSWITGQTVSLLLYLDLV